MSSNVFCHLNLAAFQEPKRRSTVTRAWHGHIPFAFWCMASWQPKTFVELGTHLGDSYFAFCQSVAANRVGTKCFAVDTWQGDAHAGAYGDETFKDVDSYNRQNYSTFSSMLRMRFDEALGQFADGTVDLLHIDGFHTYEAVRHDFETWLPKLSRQGVVLFHDSNVHERDFGVWRFMQQLDGRFPHFHFLHSHGLSMIAMSEAAPETARMMTKMSPSEVEDWRLVFSRLGSYCSTPNPTAESPGLASRAVNAVFSKIGKSLAL